MESALLDLCGPLRLPCSSFQLTTEMTNRKARKGLAKGPQKNRKKLGI